MASAQKKEESFIRSTKKIKTSYQFPNNHMKRILPLLVILFLSVGSYAQQAAQSFTLEQCIEFAKENNPNLKNARSSITSSEAKVGEITAAGLPQITGSADLGNNFIIPTSFLPAQIVGGPPGEYVGVKFGTQYTGRASLNLDQMIF